jgi:hypothetical protein
MSQPINRQLRHKQQAVLRQNIVSDLYKQGYNYREIREEVMKRLDIPRYSLQTVHADVQSILAEWRQMRNLNIEELQQLELQRIDTIIKEASEAWEKSKTDYDKKRSKQYGRPTGDSGGDGEGGIETVGVEQSREEMVMCGDVRYLDMIHKVSMERRKILGLYAPEKREITGKDGRELLPNIKVEIIDSREQVNTDDDTDNEGVCRNTIGFNR